MEAETAAGLRLPSNTDGGGGGSGGGGEGGRAGAHNGHTVDAVRGSEGNVIGGSERATVATTVMQKRRTKLASLKPPLIVAIDTSYDQDSQR